MIATKSKTPMFLALLGLKAVFSFSPSFAQDHSAGTATKLAEISITAGDKVIMGELIDTPTSRDLLAQLPVTLPMSRLREREYYGRPISPLSTEARKREGFDNGDIGYTARSGYLALFFDNSKDPEISELIVIGKVTSGLSVFSDLGQSVDMTIERVGAN